MNTAKDLTVTIPAGIASLASLNLAEKVALARIAKLPGTSNASLGGLLGLSKRGAENVLHRLRAKGYIRAIGKGRARRHQLTFPVEQRSLCDDKQRDECHIEYGVNRPEMAIAKAEPSTSDFITVRLSYCENCFESGDFAAAQNHLQQIRDRVENDPGVSAEQKANWMPIIQVMQDRCFAFGVGAKLAKQLPPSKQQELALALCRASTEKLALFRERVEAVHSLGSGEGVLGLLAE